jgi:hypothetical protein
MTTSTDLYVLLFVSIMFWICRFSLWTQSFLGTNAPGLMECLTCPRGRSPVPLVRESGLGLLWSFPCPGGSSMVCLVRECGRGLLWSCNCP